MKYLKITKQQAFYLGIVMWGYLYLFPEVDEKSKLPRPLWKIIKQLYFNCPCCAIYYNKETRQCPGCPLENNCMLGKGYYITWAETKSITTRKKYAKIILDKILASQGAK